jgi:hypothetical protein
VRAETVEFDSRASLQVKPRTHTTALLRDRAMISIPPVQEGSAIVQASVAKGQDKDGRRMKSVAVNFDSVLSAEAGAVLSRVSADASFELPLTTERGRRAGGCPDA